MSGQVVWSQLSMLGGLPHPAAAPVLPLDAGNVDNANGATVGQAQQSAAWWGWCEPVGRSTVERIDRALLAWAARWPGSPPPTMAAVRHIEGDGMKHDNEGRHIHPSGLVVVIWRGARADDIYLR